MIAIRFSCFLCLLLLTVAAADAAESRIYRTVDEQGNVVFTDVPPKADDTGEQVVVENPNTFESKQAAPDAEAWVVESPEGAEEAIFSYDRLTVASPSNDESVRENAGNVTIIATVEPLLRPGHVMRLLIDGALVQEGHKTTFPLANVDRGTHVVKLEVVDDEGRVLKESEDSTFHMLRYAIRPTPRPGGD
jgi:hypothetical protein